MDASSVTNTLFSHLNFRAERQKVISGNIANINTPNYKTQDLVFDNMINKPKIPMMEMHQTNSNHFNNISNFKNYNSPQLIEIKGLEEQNDGNNVNLDSQVSEMSKNKVMFDALQSAIKKDSRLFRSVIESSAKN